MGDYMATASTVNDCPAKMCEPTRTIADMEHEIMATLKELNSALNDVMNILYGDGLVDAQNKEPEKGDCMANEVKMIMASAHMALDKVMDIRQRLA